MRLLDFVADDPPFAIKASQRVSEAFLASSTESASHPQWGIFASQALLFIAGFLVALHHHRPAPLAALISLPATTTHKPLPIVQGSRSTSCGVSSSFETPAVHHANSDTFDLTVTHGEIHLHRNFCAADWDDFPARLEKHPATDPLLQLPLSTVDNIDAYTNALPSALTSTIEEQVTLSKPSLYSHFK
ncbi:hypothetical protein C8R45DRAFT_1110750 [Mycena sanguinolenta]|nr:hypothetical protein C8R45DRAFT_1110750 [Mycena sanguinolenta]